MLIHILWENPRTEKCGTEMTFVAHWDVRGKRRGGGGYGRILLLWCLQSTPEIAKWIWLMFSYIINLVFGICIYKCNNFNTKLRHYWNLWFFSKYYRNWLLVLVSIPPPPIHTHNIHTELQVHYVFIIHSAYFFMKLIEI